MIGVTAALSAGLAALTCRKHGRALRRSNGLMDVPAAADTTQPDGGHCPACGGELTRVHRHALDRWVSLFRSVHRYRCLDPGCGWEGVLGRDADTVPAPATAKAGRRTVFVAFVLGAACALGAVQAVRFFKQREQAAAAVMTPPMADARHRARAIDPGVDFPGVALDAADARVRNNPSPLQLRHSCVWGVPGADPYRGTVAQALAAARLPPEVVRRIAEMAERGWNYGQVAISRDGVRSVSGDRKFGSVIRAMAFGDKLCFNMRVNFPAGHVEYAALYQADDSKGKTYTVMVPYVCQNVSVLDEREEVFDYETPEPSTLLMSLLGLALLYGWRRAG